MRSRIEHAVVLSGSLVVLGACGGDDDETVRETAAPMTVTTPSVGPEQSSDATSADGLLVCEDLDLSTALGSCDEAQQTGIEIARRYLPGATAEGLEITFATICFVMQDEGGQPSRAPSADREMAVELDAREVCPGDPGMLISE